MSKGRNDTGKRVVMMDVETLQFALRNCEVNLSQNMSLLQMVHDDKLDLGEQVVRGLVELSENFRRLKKVLEEAE